MRLDRRNPLRANDETPIIQLGRKARPPARDEFAIRRVLLANSILLIIPMMRDSVATKFPVRRVQLGAPMPIATSRGRRISAVFLARAGAVSTISCSPTDNQGVPDIGRTEAAITSLGVPTDQGLCPLVQLTGKHLITADLVAAAKWNTDQPIDDLPREKAVLDTAREQAIQHGANPTLVERVFSDQIAANKIVQHALHHRWQLHPDDAQIGHPDLVTVIRPTLDRIGAELLDAINNVEPLLSTDSCVDLPRIKEEEVQKSAGLDQLHSEGLRAALAHVCTK